MQNRAYNYRSAYSCYPIGAAMLVAAFVFVSAPVLIGAAEAQEGESSSTETIQELPKEERRLELQRQLEALQQQIQQYQTELNKYRSEKQSYSREIAILENEIGKLQLEIQENEVMLSQTELSIETNQEIIELLSSKSETQKELLAEILLNIYKTQGTSTIEIVLEHDTVSEFFDNVQRMENVQDSLLATLQAVLQIRQDIEEEQRQLEEQRESQLKLIQIREIQQGSIALKVGDKEVLRVASLEKESEFQDLTNQTQRSISEVRNQLFVLEGAGVATSFGEAYEYAKFATQITGVRPAFLLAVLKRESSWGANVGQCYLRDVNTGVGVGKNTGRTFSRVMKPSRDVQPFLQITQELGRDPFNTPVSCPHPSYGWGGAMGPAQFIPSTWIGFRDRVAAALRHAPDPWNIQDAFVASAVKLAAAGAANQTLDTEWKAAMIYYAGGNWNNPAYWPYANWIMDKAAEYQGDIDILEGR